MTQKLLSLHELSERTGLPVAWLKREADAGRLPCVRAGRRMFFDAEAVRQVLVDRQRDAQREGVARG